MPGDLFFFAKNYTDLTVRKTEQDIGLPKPQRSTGSQQTKGGITMKKITESTTTTTTIENETTTVPAKNITEVVFILDRSGSMGGLEADTIGGYNSMLQKQKEEEGDVLISTVLFDDRTEVIHDRKSLKDVDPLTDKEYYVRGCTALLDAIGGSIHHINQVQKAMPEDQRPDKTIFIITTDGLENASQSYDYDKVKKMVEKKKAKKGWEFIFMGANIDAIDVAHKFGVDANRAVTYESDCMGTTINYGIMSDIVSRARKAKGSHAMSESFDDEAMFEPARAHYAKTHSLKDSGRKSK